MLEELMSYHNELMSSIDNSSVRFLYEEIHWDTQAICLLGARGVGKTTLLCQHFLKEYQSIKKALYISADNIHVLSHGLLNIVSRYFDLGGEAIFIDEVHKYPNWSIEIKNIIDIYRKKKIIFSGSSAMELKRSKADLSRRVLYYELPGLSFREYLCFNKIKVVQPFDVIDVFINHIEYAELFKDVPIQKYFIQYLKHGYYPYFLENIDHYLLKLNNVIEKVITEDIFSTKGIKQNTIIVLKKILWLISTSICLSPNIDKIANHLGTTREIIYSAFEYLRQAGLISVIYPNAKSMHLIRKPGKVYLNNTNLLRAINGDLFFENDTGTLRETFLVNQMQVKHSIKMHGKADFIINNQHIIEVGGKSKTGRQIKNEGDAYLAIDGIQIGVGKRIPLYLFGCLY